MTAQSRRGVFNNLAESFYRVEMHGVRFYFSSRFNQQRFMARLQENRKIQAERFERRYHVRMTNYTLADILLYRSIEKRGFRIVDEMGGEATCPEQLESMVHVQAVK